MAYDRPPVLTYISPNPVINECAHLMRATRSDLREIEVAFEQREVLTNADIAETQTRLGAVGAILARLGTELADPASGVRIKGGRRIVQ